jgi:hypothetical protein
MATDSSVMVHRLLEAFLGHFRPFVQSALEQHLGRDPARSCLHRAAKHSTAATSFEHADISLLVRIAKEQYYPVFFRILGAGGQALLDDVRLIRNQWAHQQPFSAVAVAKARSTITELFRRMNVVAPEIESLELRGPLSGMGTAAPMNAATAFPVSSPATGAVSSKLSAGSESSRIEPPLQTQAPVGDTDCGTHIDESVMPSRNDFPQPSWRSQLGHDHLDSLPMATSLGPPTALANCHSGEETPALHSKKRALVMRVLALLLVVPLFVVACQSLLQSPSIAQLRLQLEEIRSEAAALRMRAQEAKKKLTATATGEDPESRTRHAIAQRNLRTAETAWQAWERHGEQDLRQALLDAAQNELADEGRLRGRLSRCAVAWRLWLSDVEERSFRLVDGLEHADNDYAQIEHALAKCDAETRSDLAPKWSQAGALRENGHRLARESRLDDALSALAIQVADVAAFRREAARRVLANAPRELNQTTLRAAMAAATLASELCPGHPGAADLRRQGDALARLIDICPPGCEPASLAAAEDGRPIEVLHRPTGILLRLVATTEHRPFYLGKTEVSVAQWKAGGGNERGEDPPDWLPKLQRPQWNESHPVASISWHEAADFCNRNGLRLPMQAEWEQAAAAGTAHVYWWGDSPAAGRGRGNFLGDETPAELAHPRFRWPLRDEWPATAPVDRRDVEANPWGFLDTLGNVAEWTADATAGDRVARGGGWNVSPALCRLDSVYKLKSTARHWAVGCRVAADAPTRSK